MNHSMESMYHSVSCELKTPELKIGNFTIGRIKEFVQSAHSHSINAVRNFSSDKGTGTSSGDIVNYKEKMTDFVFSDLAPVNIYTPGILGRKVFMFDYAKNILERLKLVEQILEISSHEPIQVLDRYIGRPKELQDLTPSVTNKNSETINLSLINLSEGAEKLIDVNGVRTIRQFREVYPRLVDYYATIDIAKECWDSYRRILSQLDKFKKAVNEVNDKANRLFQNASDNDSKYQMGSVAATKVTQVCYQFAKEAEFVGATLYNADVFLKSIRDTNLVVERVISK